MANVELSNAEINLLLRAINAVLLLDILGERTAEHGLIPLRDKLATFNWES